MYFLSQHWFYKVLMIGMSM